MDRLLGGIDLAIDLATLGEFGLEEVPADGHGCELTGPGTASPRRRAGASRAGWEALAPARRPGCTAAPALSGVGGANRI
jgi:hypothetical protein